jgi:hypothetical protein
MLANKAHPWVENYLYRARGHRALEESVLAEGGRQGFSERNLRKAARSLNLSVDAGCWELHPARANALVHLELAQLTLVPSVSVAAAFAAPRRASA